jgi:hypothetical protein
LPRIGSGDSPITRIGSIGLGYVKSRVGREDGHIASPSAESGLLTLEFADHALLVRPSFMQKFSLISIMRVDVATHKEIRSVLTPWLSMSCNFNATSKSFAEAGETGMT